ncbi:MAG: hypothetical protein JWR16_3139 [Nevskia sp.]|nr:hypothetical protein [Nevskia sp.]
MSVSNRDVMGRLLCGLAAVVVALSSALGLALPRAARADDTPPPQAGRLGLIEENDGILSHQDRHYTQGLRISYLSGSLPQGSFWDRSFDWIGVVLPMYRSSAESQRRFEWQVLGQSEFTPKDTHLVPPDPTDRPYAAWLYTGFDWLQENDGHSLHNLEAQVGVVGPAAFGKQVQNGYHAIAGFGKAEGWKYELANRPAFQFSYEYHRRLELELGDRFGFDFVPEAGLSMGTVMRYAEVGGLLRFGNALHADYGPERIRPALSGTAYFDERGLGTGKFHFYLFAGAQGRRVFYNRFIDGSKEIENPGIDRKQEVADFVGGTSLFFTRRVRADFSAVLRTAEYSGQPRKDSYGSAEISVQF